MFVLPAWSARCDLPAWALRRLPIAALIAVLLPTLIGFDGPVFPRAWKQVTALAGWGLFCLVLMLAARDAVPSRSVGRLRWVNAAFGFLAVGCLVSVGWHGLPAGFGAASLGFLAAAALCAAVGVRMQQSGLGPVAFRALCEALMAVAVCGILIGAVQTFMPNWIDGWFLRDSSAAVRIGGNLSQPNQLASFIVMAMVALVWVHEAAEHQPGAALRWRRLGAVVFGMFLGVGLAYTLSRSGAVGVAIVCAWALVDRRLSRFSRVLAWTMGATSALIWPQVYKWWPGKPGEVKQILWERSAEPSSYRGDLWSNCLDLIRQSPWGGVGWGEFNLAWTLTSFGKRFNQFPDHAHNLAIQFAVELGLPASILISALLLAALGTAFRSARLAMEPDRRVARCALVMVLVIAFHSLVELPLWMAFMLLPTAFALGLATGGRSPESEAGRPSVVPTRALALGGVLLFAGGVWGATDYVKALHVSNMKDGAPEAAARVFFYRPHAEWLADQSIRRPPVERPFHIMMQLPPVQQVQLFQWSQALAAEGDFERARYLARLMKGSSLPEIRRAFAACHEPAASGVDVPYQCTPPREGVSYADFQRR